MFTGIETKILQDIIGDRRHRGGMILVLIRVRFLKKLEHTPHLMSIWGFPEMVVPNNHRFFLLKLIISGCFGGYHLFGKHPYTPNLVIASTLSLVFLHFYHQNYIVSLLGQMVFNMLQTHLQKTYSAEIVVPKNKNNVNKSIFNTVHGRNRAPVDIYPKID